MNSKFVEDGVAKLKALMESLESGVPHITDTVRLILQHIESEFGASAKPGPVSEGATKE